MPGKDELPAVPAARLVNLGCGSRLKPGWINVDIVALPGVDVVHDLDVGPWPWDSSSLDAIEAWDVFEHVNDPIMFMTESWRVLKVNAPLQIHTPHFSCIDAFTDPTHKRFPTEHTFDYWIPGTVLFQHNAAYGGARFRLVTMFMDNGSMSIQLRKENGNGQ